jgi:Na+-driven multidrug efflux pump
MNTLKIRDASGWTIFIFGLLAFLLGLVGLIRPEILLSILGFDVVERAQREAGDYTIVFMTASSMASFNVGIYYVLAALNNVKIFYRWTVPFRTLTFIVFTTIVFFGIAPQKFLGVAVWELAGALATGIALSIEDRKERKSAPQPTHREKSPPKVKKTKK